MSHFDAGNERVEERARFGLERWAVWLGEYARGVCSQWTVQIRVCKKEMLSVNSTDAGIQKNGPLSEQCRCRYVGNRCSQWTMQMQVARKRRS